MARALRIEVAGGRYHINRPRNERRPICRQDRDRIHFLELLSEWPARFGVEAACLRFDGQPLPFDHGNARGPLRPSDRDAALWLGRHVGRRRLAEFGSLGPRLRLHYGCETVSPVWQTPGSGRKASGRV